MRQEQENDMLTGLLTEPSRAILRRRRVSFEQKLSKEKQTKPNDNNASNDANVCGANIANNANGGIKNVRLKPGAGLVPSDERARRETVGYEPVSCELVPFELVPCGSPPRGTAKVECSFSQ